MALGPLAQAGIAAAASVAGQGIGALATGKMNKRAEQFSYRMYGQQRADALADWNMQNAYNDPSAQMKRLQAAGLNPNLVYGNGADAQSGSAPRAASQSTPNYKVPSFDVGSVVFNALQAKQLNANIARTEAETEAIRSRTVGTDFQNQLNQKIGLDQMEYKYNIELNKMDVQQKRELQEFEAYLTASGDPRDAASPRVKAIKASYDMAEKELQNATTRGDIMSAEKTIKKFEASLAEQGISPNSPYWLKAVMSLAGKFGLTDFLK